MPMREVQALAAYMACVPAANWMISNIGTQVFPGGPHTIPVGFGYSAPSGVLLIGAALAARDWVHRLAGVRPALAAIAVGAALSWFVNPALALASALAFALGELADLFVYVPLARRRQVLAIVGSGVIGGVVDSLVFLQVAFGSSRFWQGQVIGKALVAAACGLIVAVWRAVSVRLDSVEA